MTVRLSELNQPHTDRVQEHTGKMVELIDRNEPGGWMVRASVLGGLVQKFYVYEIDEKKPQPWRGVQSPQRAVKRLMP